MAEPNHTLQNHDPEARGLPAGTTLGVHVLPLTYGGELTVTEHDGEYQAHLTKDNLTVQVRLSVLDVWGMRGMAGDIVMERVSE